MHESLKCKFRISVTNMQLLWLVSKTGYILFIIVQGFFWAEYV